MDISAAALPPIQPAISAADRGHPLFSLYSQHRAFCSNNLIEASSFPDWLFQYERDIAAQEIAKHPRFKEWQQWMRDNQGGARACPAGTFPHNFNYWLEGGRW
jgi:hypothetical protein